jgi:hypothetical protein
LQAPCRASADADRGIGATAGREDAQAAHLRRAYCAEPGFDPRVDSAEKAKAMPMRPRDRHALRGALLVAILASGCRRPEAPAPTAPPAAPGERDGLLALIKGLDEVAPCLADAGAAGVRLVDAELAGDAATATFACANGAASGKVTFFRVAGTWMVSTKEIRGAARDDAQSAARATTPVPAVGSRTSVAPRAR